MANNRSIISWDVVLESKTYPEILNMLFTNYKAIYGADIDLSSNTADGEFIRLIADMLYDFGVLAADVYGSFDINNAKGTLLDNLVLLSGNLIRKTAAKTKLNCTLQWDSIDIPYAETDIIRIEDNANRLWKVTPYVQFANIIEATGTAVYLECVQNGDFILEEPILEIRKNGAFVSSTAIDATNLIYELRGSVREGDSLLRARKKETISYRSTSLIDSIREDVSNNIYALQDIKIYNSNFDMNAGVNPGINIVLWNGIDAIAHTIPLHDVFVLIKPQEDVTIVSGESISTALVDTLQRKITLGISTYQTDILMIDAITNDDNYHEVIAGINPNFPGYNEIYRYYVAQPYNPAIQIHIDTLGLAYNGTTSLERIRAALYNLSFDYPINKDLSIAEITGVAFKEGNIDPTNPTFEVNSIVITGGKVVNNGYWFVDGLNDTNITIVID